MSGTISSAGIGSGLDVNGLVTQLVAAERAPAAARISRQESTTRTEISAFGQLRSSLANFQTALTTAGSLETTEARSFSLSQEDFLDLSVEPDAALGSYDIIVERLATSGRSANQTPVDPSAAVGMGTLDLNLGSDSFSISIADANADLFDLRDAINDAVDNPGLRATVINVDGGSVLSLSSSRTGNQSDITLSGTGDLGTFAADIAQTTSGLDSQIRIDGLLKTSDSNAISDAIEGVTLSLLQADLGQTTTITVSRDDSVLRESLTEFVDAYNSFANTADSLGGFNEAAGRAGALNGNSLLRSVESQLRNAITGDYGGFRASEFGLRFDSQGKLQLDAEALDTALASRRDDLQSWWSSEAGLVAGVGDLIDTQLDDDSSLSSREESLQNRLDALSERRDRLDVRMARVETRLFRQFGALDANLAQLQFTSNALAQQLASLPQINSGQNGS